MKLKTQTKEADLIYMSQLVLNFPKRLTAWILLSSVMIFSCKEPIDPLENDLALRLTLNGQTVNYDSYWFYDTQPNDNQYNCYYRSYCPTDSLGQRDSLCVLSYDATCLTADRKYFFLFQVKMLVPSANLSNAFQSPIHTMDEDMLSLFVNQNFPFIDSTDSIGVRIWIKDVVADKLYFSDYADSPNTDGRFYFFFNNDGYITDYTYLGTGYDGNRELSVSGGFGAVAYSDDGDSIVMEDGVFRLTYCE